MSVQQVLTGGNFGDEPTAWVHFDAQAERNAMFRVHREVWGELIQPRFGCDDPPAESGGPVRKGNWLRIDRILVPSRKVLDAGWCGGLIGVEGKRSGAKIGKVISQALDYSRCVFELPDTHFLVMVRWVFLWPLEGEPKGDLGSVMAQNRIGWVRSSTRTPLVFGCGMTHGITVNFDGTADVQQLPMGRKKGNRG